MRSELNGRDDSGSVGRREEQWRRLGELVEAVQGRGLPELSDREVDELGRLYRAAASHLALLQTFGASVRQRDRLNRLVTQAHAVVYGQPPEGGNRRVLLWSLFAFPETVRRTGRFHLAAAALLLLGFAYGFLGAARDPDWALEFAMPGDDRTPYASRAELEASLVQGRPGEDDAIGAGEKAVFAAMLWRHNTTIALTAFFTGLLVCVPTTLLLLLNGTLLGVYSHTFHAHGLAYGWWAWILPHGVTELLAVVLLSGGGLLVGYRMLAPGRLSRADALREVRPDALRLVVFAFPMLLLAALLESFVRQSGLSEPARYAFAAATAVGWTAYLGFGRVPRALVVQERAARSVAQRAAPLAIDEEFFGVGASGGRRRQAP